MQYATDFVKIDNERPAWSPLRNDVGPVLNNNIYSLIDGIVVKLMDGIPDYETWSWNYPYKTGI